MTTNITDTILIITLMLAAIGFTIATKGAQFRFIREMVRQLFHSGRKEIGGTEDILINKKRSISSFQAFVVSVAARIGIGNLAGVAIAISVGGPGAVFWMWVMALLCSATAFIESTLAQLYKVKGNDSFLGGPCYYIMHGLHNRWWAIAMAIITIFTLSYAGNAVQSQTLSNAFEVAFNIPTWLSGAIITALLVAIIFGGIQSIAKFSQWALPFMGIGYVLIALVIVIINYQSIPHVLSTIVREAFGMHQAAGGSIGMAMIWGIKRGLFSNEAGEGSTPIVAATASVSHPVKQGLLQSLGVFTDTLIICTATAIIILCHRSGIEGYEGIEITQRAIDHHLGVPGLGQAFVSIAVLFFAFTSMLGYYYYGESCLRFLRSGKAWLTIFRISVAIVLFLGSVSSIDTVWQYVDITMAIMTISNLIALGLLGKYAIRCLKDFQQQRKAGKDPVYKASTIPEIENDTPCWK